LIQTATGYLVSGLVIGSNPTPEAMEMIHVAGGLNFLFGTTIGTFASFYHNVRRRGEVWWQTVKSSMVSVAFAISLKLLGPDGFATLNIFDPSLGVLPWIQIANMVQNFAANNMLKTAWYQWADLRSEARVDRDNYV